MLAAALAARGEFYPEDFLIQFAARHVGRPVRWLEDRREHLTAMNHARQADCGPDPLLGKGHECRFLQPQRQGGGDRERTGFPKSRRRCLVPVDNFYEWKKTGTGKQPYAIALADRGIMPLACLWENWHSPADTHIRDHHHPTERVVRRAPQPHARRAETGRMAGLARRAAGDRIGSEGDASPLPFR